MDSSDAKLEVIEALLKRAEYKSDFYTLLKNSPIESEITDQIVEKMLTLNPTMEDYKNIILSASAGSKVKKQAIEEFISKSTDIEEHLSIIHGYRKKDENYITLLDSAMKP